MPYSALMDTLWQQKDKIQNLSFREIVMPTWQVTGCVIVVAVVLDKRWWGRNVTGLHRWHTGRSADR